MQLIFGWKCDVPVVFDSSAPQHRLALDRFRVSCLTHKKTVKNLTNRACLAEPLSTKFCTSGVPTLAYCQRQNAHVGVCVCLLPAVPHW